ncbi:hypothetical protein V8E55_003991 [Tylopilus felleus]|jgi:hypothetical protein
MKFITLAAALLAAIPAALGLTVNTPANVVECEPTQIDWSGGTAPYYLTFVPAAQISAPAIKQFPTQTGDSYTWNVDLQAGVSFTIVLKDSTGASAYSDIVTVVAGTSISCVNSNVTETGGSSGGSATGSGSGSSATGKSASGTPTSTSSSSSSTHSNAAGRLSTFSVNAVGVAGIMGLVGAALF